MRDNSRPLAYTCVHTPLVHAEAAPHTWVTAGAERHTVGTLDRHATAQMMLSNTKCTLADTGKGIVSCLVRLPPARAKVMGGN